MGDLRENGRIVSNWWFSPQLGNSVVECRDGGERDNAAVVTFNVVDSMKGITLVTEDEDVTKDNDDEDEAMKQVDDENNQSGATKLIKEIDAVKSENTLESGQLEEEKFDDATIETGLETADYNEDTLDIETGDEQYENTEIVTETNAAEPKATSAATVDNEVDTEEHIRPENEPEVAVAKLKDSSPSNIALDSVKSSFISTESSSSSLYSFSSFLSILFLQVLFLIFCN